MLLIYNFYDESLISVFGIPIHRETMTILNIYWANLKPRIVLNLGYSFCLYLDLIMNQEYRRSLHYFSGCIV